MPAPSAFESFLKGKKMTSDTIIRIPGGSIKPKTFKSEKLAFFGYSRGIPSDEEIKNTDVFACLIKLSAHYS